MEANSLLARQRVPLQTLCLVSCNSVAPAGVLASVMARSHQALWLRSTHLPSQGSLPPRTLWIIPARNDRPSPSLA